MAGLAAAFGSGAMTNSVPEFSAHTQCFLITGSNTSEAHPLVASHVYEAKERADQGRSAKGQTGQGPFNESSSCSVQGSYA